MQLTKTHFWQIFHDKTSSLTFPGFPDK